MWKVHLAQSLALESSELRDTSRGGSGHAQCKAQVGHSTDCRSLTQESAYVQRAYKHCWSSVLSAIGRKKATEHFLAHLPCEQSPCEARLSEGSWLFLEHFIVVRATRWAMFTAGILLEDGLGYQPPRQCFRHCLAEPWRCQPC